VDGMNVIGTRPTGWWRDRPRAMRELVESLGAWAERKGETVGVVFDGREVPIPEGPVEVTFAPGGPNAADHVIAELVEAAADPGALRVVTSDRALAERVRAAGAEVVGARGFRELLDGPTS